MRRLLVLCLLLPLAAFGGRERTSGQFTVAAPSAYNGECTSMSDLAALPPGTLCEAPSSWLDADGRGTVIYDKWFSSVMYAWNGGTFDSTNNQFIVTGSGHDDGPYNGVWGFDLDTFSWETVATQSIEADIPRPNPAENVSVYNDGRPSGRHTYYGVVFDSTRDAIYLLGGSLWNFGGGDGKMWKHNIATDTWTELLTNAAITLISSVYIEEFDAVIFSGYTSNFKKYNPSTNTIVDLGAYNPGDGYRGPLVWDPINEILVAFGYTYARHITFDAGVTTATVANVSTTGCSSVTAAQNFAGVWDTVSERVIYYLAGSGDTTFYAYDPATLTCETLTAAPENLTVPDYPTAFGLTNGIFSRFQAVPGTGVFVGVNCTRCNVFFWRPPA